MNTSFCRRLIVLSSSLLSSFICLPAVLGADTSPGAAKTPPAASSKPARKAASEDPLIVNYHSLGKLGKKGEVVRCANPVDGIAERLKGAEPTADDLKQAKAQMQHLYDRGIRTVISLQRQEAPTDALKNPEYAAVTLEKAAAKEVGLTYVSYSMANRGKDALSLQYMPDDTVFKLIETIGNDIIKRSETGGVAFHCKSGKDRTGLVAGYLRVKHQGWSVDDAIEEMRANGHVWKSFLKPGQFYSWHENHLRGIASRLGPSDSTSAGVSKK